MFEEMFEAPSVLSSIIKVIGVGGGGGNAVNYMFQKGIKDVNFVVCNTDSQALAKNPVPLKIQLGKELTKGRGAGNQPEKGRESAIESLEDIKEILSDNTNMVFITAGMGGGTGTGAAPVIARAAKELGILTVGIVTLPFHFEGIKRINQAIEGIAEMEKCVDSLLVINNERLREMYGDLPLSAAFSKADDVLAIAAKGIAEIITVHGRVNVDFADVETVMSNSGVSVMGSAVGEGNDRAIDAIQAALESPLLNYNNIKGATNVLLNIASGVDEIRMDELKVITDYVGKMTGYGANVIWGSVFDESLGDKVGVTIVATGFTSDSFMDIIADKEPKVTKVALDEDGNLLGDVIDFSSDEDEEDDDNKSRVVTFTDDNHRTKLIESLYGSSAAKPMQTPTSNEIEFPSGLGERYQRNRVPTTDFTEDEGAVEQLENVPAYKRRGARQAPQESPQKKSSVEPGAVSRFSISSKGGNSGVVGENPYLHDNVD